LKSYLNNKLYVVLVLSLYFSCGSDEGVNQISEMEEPPSTVFEFEYNDKKYEIIKENKSWVNAAADAVARGGYLAEVNSSGENSAIFSAATVRAEINLSKTIASDGGNASYIWIGGNDLSTEGEWVWNGNNDATAIQFWQGNSAGQAVDGLYNNWGNEPDNFNQAQHALGLALTQWPVDTGNLGSERQWNDIAQGNAIYYVVEYD